MPTLYPPAGTWDVIDRHGEPRYVVEHDGKGGWWGVCQPDRPEDCYVLAASKRMKEFIETAINPKYGLQEHLQIHGQKILRETEGR